MKEQIVFRYELLNTVEEVRNNVRMCEGRHVQQCAYSTFMDTLTQICFTEQVIRTTIQWEGNRSWNTETNNIKRAGRSG